MINWQEYNSWILYFSDKAEKSKYIVSSNTESYETECIRWSEEKEAQT